MNKTIDWSKAPSDATHAGIDGSGIIRVWYRNIRENDYSFCPTTRQCWNINKGAPGYNLIPRPIVVNLPDVVHFVDITCTVGNVEPDLTKLDTPFGELDRATQLLLVEHVLDGGEVQIKDRDSVWFIWTDNSPRRFSFTSSVEYRAVAKQPTELEQLESESASLLEQMTQLDNKIKTLKGGAV